MKIQDYLEAQRQRVEDYLSTLYRQNGPSKLQEAVRYSLMAGGKRIRPILTLAAYEACGGGAEEGTLALPVAATFEMIHTYSLIHDDLPAMDNDDLRRGRPTNHKVFGDALAILAGDALLTDAFALLASLPTQQPDRLLQVMRELAVAAGGEGMAGGQALDLDAEGRAITPEQLERLHRMKTGCLIQGAVVAGALVAGANQSELQSLRAYGSAIGLSFQIADDILDVEGETKDLGKTAGSDAAHSKSTYPSLLGLQKSKELARQLTEQAIAALAEFNARAEPLREIARYIVARKS